MNVMSKILNDAQPDPLAVDPNATTTVPRDRGAVNMANIIREITEDAAGIISALETALQPVCRPGAPLKPLSPADYSAQAPLLATLNHTGERALHNLDRLRRLVESIQV